MFWPKRKKHVETKPYDAAKQVPVIRASICTGEQVAGFQDKGTGRFEEAMLVRGNADLQEFCTRYGVKPEEIKKVW